MLNQYISIVQGRNIVLAPEIRKKMKTLDLFSSRGKEIQLRRLVQLQSNRDRQLQTILCLQALYFGRHKEKEYPRLLWSLITWYTFFQPQIGGLVFLGNLPRIDVLTTLPREQATGGYRLVRDEDLQANTKILGC